MRVLGEPRREEPVLTKSSAPPANLSKNIPTPYSEMLWVWAVRRSALTVVLRPVLCAMKAVFNTLLGVGEMLGKGSHWRIVNVIYGLD
jgi:hypothetical protein